VPEHAEPTAGLLILDDTTSRSQPSQRDDRHGLRRGSEAGEAEDHQAVVASTDVGEAVLDRQTVEEDRPRVTDLDRGLWVGDVDDTDAGVLLGRVVLDGNVGVLANQDDLADVVAVAAGRSTCIRRQAASHRLV
jgi:hypothetical protein